MNKVKINGDITLREKIYFDKDAVEKPQQLQSAFTYQDRDEVFTTLEEDEYQFAVPSGAWKKLEWTGKAVDERIMIQTNEDINFQGILRNEQQEAANAFCNKNVILSGILQARCGWGKTFVGCYLISKSNQRTLILVHTKLLWRQWIEEIEKQLNIEPGRIGDGDFIKKDITVGIYKSVYNNIESIKEDFGVTMVDEVHLCPAEMFSSTVNNINSKIKFGISATPVRKDGKHLVLPDYFTPRKFRARDEETDDIDIYLEIVRTDFPFMAINPQRDWAKQLTKIAGNSKYIELISNKAIEKIQQGRCILILSERLDMLKALKKLIPRSVLLVGATKEEDRQKILNNVGTDYKVILTTKIFDEGISCHRLDTLFLTCPHNNFPKLEQRVGRIIREHPDKKVPLVVDFFLKGPIVARQQQKRKEWYIQNGYIP